MSSTPPQVPGIPPLGIPVPQVPVRSEPRWEYRLLTRNLAREDAPSEADLNALGRDGWEMAGVFTDSPFVYLYFKRLCD